MALANHINLLLCKLEALEGGRNQLSERSPTLQNQRDDDIFVSSQAMAQTKPWPHRDAVH